MTIHTHGYATHSATSEPVPFTFERRDPRPADVVIDILYCGICHSDIHMARSDGARPNIRLFQDTKSWAEWLQ